MDHELVVVGSSWGGLRALAEILPLLPADFPLPVLIAQHRSTDSSDATLAAYFGPRCQLPVGMVTDKAPILPGIYFAPADYHLLIEDGTFALSTEEHVSFSRPSIDVMFETAADVHRAGVVGVILTGANEDGAAGLKAVRDAGGFAIVQDPDTAAASSMPRAALEAVPTAVVLPLDEIAVYLIKLGGESS